MDERLVIYCSKKIGLLLKTNPSSTSRREPEYHKPPMPLDLLPVIQSTSVLVAMKCSEKDFLSFSVKNFGILYKTLYINM